MALLIVPLAGNARNRKRGEYQSADWINAIELGLNITLTGDQINNVQLLVDRFYDEGYSDERKLAYILATCYHESRLRPIKEIRARSGTRLYEVQNRYWNTGYYGRGFVQITWKSNYEKVGKLIGVNLVDNPERTLQPKIAARIAVLGMMKGWFTRYSLVFFINAMITDYFNARKVVNGLDRAALIEGYTVKIIGRLDNYV